MSALHGKAVEALSIVDVTLRRSNVLLSDNLVPSLINVEEYNAQGTRGVKKIIEMVSDDSVENKYRYSFYYEAGVRLVPSDDAAKHNNESDDFENPVLIIAVFDATYDSLRKLDDDELKEFSKANVGYHVWPFWREYVQSTCSRMGIQNIPTPFYLCKKGKEDGERSQ